MLTLNAPFAEREGATSGALSQSGRVLSGSQGTVLTSPGLLGEHSPGLTPLLGLFQLLGEDRFQDIEKIKTIGSTYMAVSGLSPEKQVMELFGLNYNLWQRPHY